ncbi:MAG: 2-amino-4-hydroxy-6-hydroxymethyldihydropteridine diphosphokinase [Lentisphaerae bacterium]|jgi:2-amino-4-hydroxy-6-hydroxymethyldihydropteridine diphosphokinase|nr:2-amino-4-hydroxy-6-hydroxymethyldihydropteridine diphosphokinase [Lentisphaerota bacterium]
MNEAGLSLGSNLGDRVEHLTAARRALAALSATRVVASSRIYETEPVGVSEEWREVTFYNAVVVVESGLSATDFSDAIHTIEDLLGRVRGAERNAPRAIDIDIIYFGSVVSEVESLYLPHPEWAGRRFVCAPLAELRPDLILPGQTESVAEVCKKLPLRPAVAIAATQW